MRQTIVQFLWFGQAWFGSRGCLCNVIWSLWILGSPLSLSLSLSPQFLPPFPFFLCFIPLPHFWFSVSGFGFWVSGFGFHRASQKQQTGLARGCRVLARGASDVPESAIQRTLGTYDGVCCISSCGLMDKAPAS